MPQRQRQTDGRTDRRTDRRLAVAIGEIAYKWCHLKKKFLGRGGNGRAEPSPPPNTRTPLVLRLLRSGPLAVNWCPSASFMLAIRTAPKRCLCERIFWWFQRFNNNSLVLKSPVYLRLFHFQFKCLACVITRNTFYEMRPCSVAMM